MLIVGDICSLFDRRIFSQFKTGKFIGMLNCKKEIRSASHSMARSQGVLYSVPFTVALLIAGSAERWSRCIESKLYQIPEIANESFPQVTCSKGQSEFQVEE
jgi:hypothetical protein